MIRDFTSVGEKNETKAIGKELEEIRELLQAKAELEARIVQDIINFEDTYKVIIDRVRFQRMITRSPRTVYTEVTLLLE